MITETVLAKSIVLPSGCSMRPAALDDSESVAALINAAARAAYGMDEITATETQSRWTIPGFDIEKSIRVITAANGQIVGYVAVWDEDDPPVHSMITGRVHPDYEGQGIGTALMAWAKGRVQQAVDRCPPEARVVYWTTSLTGHTASEQFFENLGMQPIRSSWRMLIEMESQPPTPPLLPGITIRSYRHPDDMEASLLTMRSAFKDHFGYIELPLEDELEWLRHYTKTDSAFDEKLWFVAVDETDGTFAGALWGRRRASFDSDCGWVRTLGVRREYRQRGVGMALLQHSFSEFWRRGIKKVGLGVDASNTTGATRLYEKAGMRVNRVFTLYEKELRPGMA